MRRSIFLALGVLVITSLLGCNGPAPLAYQFQSGDVERIQYVRHQTYDNWVEYPGEDPTLPSGLDSTTKQVLVRKVTSIDQDGVATMEVTFEEVTFNSTVRVQEKVTKTSYSSTGEQTESTNEGEPALSGESYTIKLAPDSRVLAVMGLEELRAKLGLGKSGSIAGSLLTAERVKDVHERHFMLSGIKTAETSEMLFVVPDVMIRAEAVKKKFAASAGQMQDGKHVVEVKGVGEPMYQRPEGFPEPPKPGDPFRTMIRSISDMQEFKADTDALFTLDDTRCQRDATSTSAKLILLEADIFQAPEGSDHKSRDGMMITEVKLERTFASLP